jgi:hypothetical protein
MRIKPLLPAFPGFASVPAMTSHPATSFIASRSGHEILRNRI